MTLGPEAGYVVTVTESAIQNQLPDGTIERMPFDDLRRVFIETDDTGPWGADVWWVLEGETPETRIRFPQGATGEDKFMAYASRLPGFAIRGHEFSCPGAV